MIRTVAQLLSEIVRQSLPELDQSEVTHAPTIGDMYEGLSSEILQRAIPDGLGLQVVKGFVADGAGLMSGQLDCMLVRGLGTKIPYTDSYIWHVKDVVAVIEVKKTLLGEQMRDAWQQLSSVSAVERSYSDIAAAEDPEVGVDVRNAQRAFAETTGRLASPYERVRDLSAADQAIFFTLVEEQYSVIRIVLGLHGFKTEAAFRKALAAILEANLGREGYSPAAFPQLIISGAYSLVKANGRPYSVPLVNGAWPFYFSSAVNPLIMLLEIIWTRLDELFGISEIWGDDLEVEVARALVLATPDENPRGWRYTFVDAPESQLRALPAEEPWSPAFLTLEEFVVVHRLCGGRRVGLDDPEFLKWLAECDLEPTVLCESLLSTGLVALDATSLVLITRECLCVILATGEYVAAENNTGRLSRWIVQRMNDDVPQAPVTDEMTARGR